MGSNTLCYRDALLEVEMKVIEDRFGQFRVFRISVLI